MASPSSSVETAAVGYQYRQPAIHREPAPFKLSYVDFAPQCAGSDGVICAPQYERFDALVNRANEWLRSNGHLRVKTCESIEVKGRLDGVVDTNKSCYYEADHVVRRMRNLYIRGLRLWVVPRDPDEPHDLPQQIGYINVVPCRNELGMFERFGETVRRCNYRLRQRPLPGCILNIESQEMKFHEWGMGVDPDESCWVESVKFNVSFLVVIRIFFELGCSACEEIGCADFVPSRIVGAKSGRRRAVLQFESFREVLQKASTWIRHQDRVRVTNVQSIDYKIRRDTDINELDSQRSFYVESGRNTTRYIRIIRVNFVKPFDGRQVIVDRPLNVDYVTFQPLILSSGGIFGIPLFETIAQTMKRAITWLSQTSPDLEIVSAETVPVRMYSGNQYGNHEVTYTWNRGDQKEFWLLVVRIYVSCGSNGNGIKGCLVDGAALYDNDLSAMLIETTTATDDRTECCNVS